MGSSIAHVGRNILRIREIRGVKQEALASALNISQQAVSKMEQSENIDDERLKKVADALGVTVEDIKNFREENVFANHVYGEHNTISQIYSQPISEIHVFNQINNPLEKVVELYERMLKEKDAMIEMYRNQNKAS